MIDDEFLTQIRIAPGDGVLMDNHRVLHGRTAFDPNQGRHVRLCQVTRDEFHARLRGAQPSTRSRQPRHPPAIRVPSMTMTDTQGQILDAVLTVIVRQGIRSLSFRAVAAEADVALGLLNYHFDDKESLIRAAYQHAAQRLMESSRTAATGTGSRDQAVRSFIRGVFGQEFLDADYLALRLSLWSVARSEPTVAAINAEIYETYLAELSALIAAARPEPRRGS